MQSSTDGGGKLTNRVLANASNGALGVDLDLGALPGAVEVGLDSHVCRGCRKISVKGGVVEAGAVEDFATGWSESS